MSRHGLLNNDLGVAGVVTGRGREVMIPQSGYRNRTLVSSGRRRRMTSPDRIRQPCNALLSGMSSQRGVSTRWTCAASCLSVASVSAIFVLTILMYSGHLKLVKCDEKGFCSDVVHSPHNSSLVKANLGGTRDEGPRHRCFRVAGIDRDRFHVRSCSSETIIEVGKLDTKCR